MVQKRKWFWSWQDEKQEAWLSEMSQQGLHLKELGYFGAYRFESGPPKRYSYRLDFMNKKRTDDYFQFIRDAGWEHLGTLAGWQYWRKEFHEGVSPEFFTDSESKIQKYQRLLLSLMISSPAMMAMMLIGLAMFKKFPGRHPSWFVVLFISVFLFVILFSALNALMVQSRIKKLKQNHPI
jgi:hypothetical protein